MTEPLDDELGEFVRAYRTVERPTPAARATTWAAIDARLAGDAARAADTADSSRRTTLVASPASPRAPTPAAADLARRGTMLAALAAAVALCVGLAAAVTRRDPTATAVEASHHAAPPPSRALERPAPLAPDRIEPLDPPDPIDPSQIIAPHSLDPSQIRAPDPTPSSEHPAPDAIAPTRLEPPESPAAPPRANSRIRPRPAPAPSLRPEEVASFQRAQAALAEGRDADALAALDAHGRRFPGGFFEEERLVSRASALCKLGRLAAARAARDRFVNDHPTSHLAERMRRICRENE